MEKPHRGVLAETCFIYAPKPQEMVGANMAFARHVLDRVPAFDPELGPGALGQCDDTLFSYQLLAAGCRIAPALDVTVEHHCAEDRLSRASYLAAAVRQGRSTAYVDYHWKHLTQSRLGLRRMRRSTVLALARRVRWRECAASEGIPLWEMRLVRQIAYLDRWRVEKQRPRNYDRYGLVKLRGVMP